MKVILLHSVKKIGNRGDVVEVSDGYARNFLLKNNLGRFADAAALAGVSRAKQADAARAAAIEKTAHRLVERIRKLELPITAPGTASGTLYAGLKESEILARLRKSVSDLPEGARLIQYEPLKAAGEYEAKLELAPGVESTLKLKISADAKK